MRLTKMLLAFGLVSAAWAARADEAADVFDQKADHADASEEASPSALDAYHLMAQRDGEEIFRRQCAVCHGENGKGNGPAAAALRPKPANLTDPDRRKISQQQVLETITKGKGTMPAFGAVLKKDEIEAVTRYVVSLSAESAADSES